METVGENIIININKEILVEALKVSDIIVIN